jgi:hypothetical protein
MPTEAVNINAVLPPWFSQAIHAMEQLCSAAPPPLSTRFAQIAARLNHLNGARTLDEGLRAAVANPSPALMEALRVDYGIAVDDPRLAVIGEAALALYFALRTQDDMVDEPGLLDRGYVYVVEVFSRASQRAFAQALAGSPRFFAFQAAVMMTFATAATWEIDTFRTGAVPEDLVRLGQKLLPMAIPLGALAVLADCAAQLDLLEQFATDLGIGLQMINDVLNVQEDHGQRRLTPVLRWLYASGTVTPEEPPARIRVALLANEVLPRALCCAQEALTRAEQVALAIDAPRLATMVRNRAAYVQSVPTQLLALYLHAGTL